MRGDQALVLHIEQKRVLRPFDQPLHRAEWPKHDVGRGAVAEEIGRQQAPWRVAMRKPFSREQPRLPRVAHRRRRDRLRADEPLTAVLPKPQRRLTRLDLVTALQYLQNEP